MDHQDIENNNKNSQRLNDRFEKNLREMAEKREKRIGYWQTGMMIGGFSMYLAALTVSAYQVWKNDEDPDQKKREKIEQVKESFINDSMNDKSGMQHVATPLDSLNGSLNNSLQIR